MNHSTLVAYEWMIAAGYLSKYLLVDLHRARMKINTTWIANQSSKNFVLNGQKKEPSSSSSSSYEQTFAAHTQITSAFKASVNHPCRFIAVANISLTRQWNVRIEMEKQMRRYICELLTAVLLNRDVSILWSFLHKTHWGSPLTFLSRIHDFWLVHSYFPLRRFSDYDSDSALGMSHYILTVMRPPPSLCELGALLLRQYNISNRAILYYSTWT